MKVLLLHALPLDERMWAPQREALSVHEVVTPNLYSLAGESMDQWAMELLREVSGEVAIVGASMGGYVALALARLAPDRVRALVLAGSRADADTPERKADRKDTIARVQEGGAQALWEKMSTLLTAGASDEVVQRLHAFALEQSAEDLVRAVKAIRDRQDSSDVVATLEAPLLVVLGDQDALIAPQEAQALAAAAPNGRAVVLEGTGHLPSLQDPDRFNAELLALLRELG
jgi:pimeloyl-ACP methyl ester carboxylesterase